MSIRQKYDGQIGFFIDAGAHSSFFKKNLSGKWGPLYQSSCLIGFVFL
jgi:hypothetical protein